MQRLTRRDETGVQVLCNHEDKDCNDSCMYGTCKWHDKAMDRLAAYEDTGLTPEEVETMKNNIDAAYQVKAGQSGAFLRVPCNVGDTVYTICKCDDIPHDLDGTLYDAGGGFGTATGYYCPYEDNCPHEDCGEGQDKLAVFEDEVSYLGVDSDGVTVAMEHTGCVVASDFGRTVFLTRADAETKLKEAEQC